MEVIKRVGLICALGREAAPIIQTLNLKQIENHDLHLPFLNYEGVVGNLSIRLTVAGMDPRYEVDNTGTNAATLFTFLLIEHFRPDLILNAGTAGGFRTKGASIGEVYLGQGDVRFHDRRSPITRHWDYCIGQYPVHSAPQLASALQLKTGLVSSGNSFDCAEVDRERMLTIGADLKDMEAAAVGWVAWMKKIPFLPLKAVTDFVEEAETAEAQFKANWRSAVSNLSDVVTRSLYFMDGKKIHDL
jgi:nucleoside phosphorylase